jgi:hypothetical protein
MRHPARGARLRTVEPPLHLDLLLERGAEPISGWINVAGRPPLEFNGYLELMGLLERVLGTDVEGRYQAS